MDAPFASIESLFEANTKLMIRRLFLFGMRDVGGVVSHLRRLLWRADRADDDKASAK